MTCEVMAEAGDMSCSGLGVLCLEAIKKENNIYYRGTCLKYQRNFKQGK